MLGSWTGACLVCSWARGSEGTGWKAKALHREPLLMLLRNIAKAEREQKSGCELNWSLVNNSSIYEQRKHLLLDSCSAYSVSGIGGDGIYLTVLVLHLVFGTATFWALQVKYCAGFLSSYIYILQRKCAIVFPSCLFLIASFISNRSWIGETLKNWVRVICWQKGRLHLVTDITKLQGEKNHSAQYVHICIRLCQ